MTDDKILKSKNREFKKFLLREFYGTSAFQFIGVLLAVGAVHTIGLKHALGSVGSVITTPANVSIVVGQLGLAYAAAVACALCTSAHCTCI